MTKCALFTVLLFVAGCSSETVTGSVQVSGGASTPLLEWANNHPASVFISVTVTDLTPRPEIPIDWGTRPYAKLTWGTSGVMTTAEVDVGRGLEIYLFGDTVSVAVGLDSPDVGMDVRFDGVLVGEVQGENRYLVRTIYIDRLPVGEHTGAIPIPAFAKHIWPVWFSENEVSSTLSVYDADGSTINMMFLHSSDNQMELKSISLPGDAYRIVLANTGGGITSARLIFELAL